MLGTLMLGILAGSRRCAHSAGVRGDAVAAKTLGLRGIVSDDSVRRALKAHLLRLRQTADVKLLIQRLLRREDWKAIENELRLSAWRRAHRVVTPPPALAAPGSPLCFRFAAA